MAGIGSVVTTKDVTILNGASKTLVIPLDGQDLVGIYVPSTIQGSQLSFQFAYTFTGTAHDLYGMDGQEVLMDFTADKHHWIDPRIFAGARFLFIRTGTTASAQAQSQDTTFTLTLRDLS